MWFKKMDKKKTTFKSGMNESEIDFVLVSKEDRKHLRDVKAVPWGLQYQLVVADADEKEQVKYARKNQM